MVNYMKGPSGEDVPIPDGEEPNKADISRTEGFTEIRCATFIGNTLLEDIPSPYEHGRLPVVNFMAYYASEGDTPSGIVRDLKDPQMEINKRRSSILHIINTTAFNGLLVEQGAMTDAQKKHYERMGSRPGGIHEVVQGAITGGRIKEVMPKPLPDAISRLESAFENDLKSISGINEEMMGTDTKASASGRAVELRQRQAVTQIAMLFDNLRHFKRQIVNILWGEGAKKGLIQQFFKEEMLLRITDDTEQPQFAPVNQTRRLGTDQNGSPITRIKNDLSTGTFDVIISESPSTPSKRYADFLALMEMMKTPLGPVLANVIPDIFLELSDLPNKAKIQQRLAQAQQQQAMPPPGAPPGGQSMGSQSNPPDPAQAQAMAEAQAAAM
jgi:hypothetical protein